MKPTDFSIHVTSFLTHYLAAQRNLSPTDEAEHAHMPAGGGMGNNGHVSDSAYLFIDRYERPR